jgi:hypothetical protein
MRKSLVVIVLGIVLFINNPIKANEEIGSIGFLRDACLLAQNAILQAEGATGPEALKIGYCFGVMAAERRLRSTICDTTTATSTTRLAGRKLWDVSTKQMIQSFLNWSQNPQNWDDNFSEHTLLSGVFMEWSCIPIE